MSEDVIEITAPPRRLDLTGRLQLLGILLRRDLETAGAAGVLRKLFIWSRILQTGPARVGRVLALETTTALVDYPGASGRHVREVERPFPDPVGLEAGMTVLVFEDPTDLESPVVLELDCPGFDLQYIRTCRRDVRHIQQI